MNKPGAVPVGQAQIHGYADRLTVKNGERITFNISAVGLQAVRARLVRLIHGDENPAGPGFIEREITSSLDGVWPARFQAVQKGNYFLASGPGATPVPQGAFTVYALVWPAMPTAGVQAILSVGSSAGYMLAIGDDGRLEFCIGQGAGRCRVQLETRLAASTWFLVSASFDPSTGAASLCQRAVFNRWNSLHSEHVPWQLDDRRMVRLEPGPLPASGERVAIGGRLNGGHVDALYNGKIDRCGIYMGHLADQDLDGLAVSGCPPNQANIFAHWDPTVGYTADGIGSLLYDIGPHALHGQGFNGPVRGQTGWNWSGRNDSFRLAPDEYGGIEFHQDALTDCRWEPTIEFDVPVELRSGIYAVKLTAAEGEAQVEEYIPFCVRSAAPTSAICFVMPTASYLAYANSQTAFDGDLAEASDKVTPVLQGIDITMVQQRAPFGLSMYDVHDDGAGVCHSSYRRPIFNMRPRYRMPANTAPWQFAADLSVVAWLEHEGYEYDVITDHDLHADGVAALAPYKVVLTGTHCEYTSQSMLDGFEDYLAGGGRLLYSAGNGFYWVVGFHPAEPWVMEVRRLEAGSRAWQARPGEHYLTSTGERGGLWRHRGRAPQKLVGTGFTAEGMDVSVPFRRLPVSYDSPVSWIFAGVTTEVVGNFGLAKGGAAGLEVDRYDRTLGTPPHTVILAQSEELTDNYQLTQEDVMATLPGMGGSENPLVRADMTYFTTTNGGAVFSASSIAWGSALPCHGFANDVSQIMRNVVDAFLGGAVLPGADWMNERARK